MEFDEYKNDLAKQIAKIDNEVIIQKFFECFITETEIRNITVCWAIFNDIMKNVPQRKIAEKYSTSLAKVNKYSKCLKNKSSFLTKMLKDRYDESSL